MGHHAKAPHGKKANELAASYSAQSATAVGAKVDVKDVEVRNGNQQKASEASAVEENSWQFKFVIAVITLGVAGLIIKLVGSQLFGW